jgi:hypothetical protein
MVPTTWRKSSYSADTVNCIEVAWRKSSFSGQEVNCVEFAVAEGFAAIRDSKNPTAPHLTLPPTAYAGLLNFAANRS